MRIKLKTNKQGFSLLEIIVTIFIIAFLSALMLADYKEGNRATELNFKAQTLAGNIRMAQNNTLGSVKYGNSMPSGGWGVYLDSLSPGDYVIFANDNYDEGSLEYDLGEAAPGQGGRTVSLGSEVKIGSLYVSEEEEEEEAVEELNISFVPPDPQTIIYDGTSTSTEATIVLETGTGKKKKIKINSFGLIEILN